MNNRKIKLTQEVIGKDNGLYKLVKVTSVKDARRRGYDISSDSISREYPFHILQKSRTWAGDKWQSVRSFQGEENIEYHWNGIVEQDPQEAEL